MRHLKSGRILGRTPAHRKALFRNLVTALIQREKIRTTLAKAKELRSKAEKTITLGKKGTLHARRQALMVLTEKSALQKLFGPLAERYANRKGGYTRIIKIGNRRGDDAPMAIIELVDHDLEKTPPKKVVKGQGKEEPKKKEAAKKEEKKETKKAAKETKQSAKAEDKKEKGKAKEEKKTTKKTDVKEKKESKEKQPAKAKAETKKKK